MTALRSLCNSTINVLGYLMRIIKRQVTFLRWTQTKRFSDKVSDSKLVANKQRAWLEEHTVCNCLSKFRQNLLTSTGQSELFNAKCQLRSQSHGASSYNRLGDHNESFRNMAVGINFSFTTCLIYVYYWFNFICHSFFSFTISCISYIMYYSVNYCITRSNIICTVK